MATSVSTAMGALPERLAERARVLGSDAAAPPRYVLYWMRTAVRAHDNPALDAAAVLARALEIPLFVYHALGERYPYASDRHHAFLLEGARDVAGQLRERGAGYAFHLERPGHRGPHLVTLAADAGLVVTEDLPVPPLHGWAARVAERAEVPVVLVDTACLVPMQLCPRPKRAFRFREQTERFRLSRIDRVYEDEPLPGRPFVPQLPFEPVDLEAASLPELIAACAIDHSVAPVADTRGGSAAGYARWRRFLEGGLKRYASDRNDPLRDGVSRMSAYLHMGFVSPFRLAREAYARDGKGPEKFVDELVVWRELAHAWCFHTDPSELERTAALPDWARETLRQHEGDPRRVLDWETLARGRTGDPLWDAAQHSLLRHGELHNNVRMTWGKAVLHWTRDAQHALDVLLDLNHRYALDGRDPASYGGLLWCLGLFDRPFNPPGPVRGRLRPRPTRSHAKRLDVAAWGAKVRRAGADPGPVAVIGAGTSGLACARALRDHGVEVTVFDKGRRVGGRLSTRRVDGHAFDHGAQFVTAKDPRFRRAMRAWRDAAVIEAWRFRERGPDGQEKDSSRPVGAGRMRALAEHLAADLDVRLETRVAPWALGGAGEDHALVDEEGRALGRFAAVVVTAPLAQAATLLEAHPWLPSRLREGVIAPCWAAMIAFDERLATDLDAVRGAGPIAWAARDSSKPGRPDGERWVVHATPECSRERLEDPPDEVAEELRAALGEALGVELPEPSYLDAHRWRYARVETPVGAPCLYDPDTRVAVAGDGLLGPKVEAAYLSGLAAAGRLLTDAWDRARGDQGALGAGAPSVVATPSAEASPASP